MWYILPVLSLPHAVILPLYPSSYSNRQQHTSPAILSDKYSFYYCFNLYSLFPWYFIAALSQSHAEKGVIDLLNDFRRLSAFPPPPTPRLKLGAESSAKACVICEKVYSTGAQGVRYHFLDCVERYGNSAKACYDDRWSFGAVLKCMKILTSNFRTFSHLIPPTDRFHLRSLKLLWLDNAAGFIHYSWAIEGRDAKTVGSRLKAFKNRIRWNATDVPGQK